MPKVFCDQKFIKNAKNCQFGEFSKLEACSQTVLPDSPILVGQKLVKNAKVGKLKCDILGDFQTLWVPLMFTKWSANKSGTTHFI